MHVGIICDLLKLAEINLDERVYFFADFSVFDALTFCVNMIFLFGFKI